MHADKEKAVQDALQFFLKAKKLTEIEKIAKGFSSEIYLVQNNAGQKFALKIERAKSRRTDMVEKEAMHLKKANTLHIGPQLIDFDAEKRIVLMEFIEGQTFSHWLNSTPEKLAPTANHNLSKSLSVHSTQGVELQLALRAPSAALKKVIKDLLAQGKQLDDAGLSHGQLAGRGKNILISTQLKPVLIDFEKASQNRKCKNVNQLKAFLFLNPHSHIVKQIKEILGESVNEFL